MLQTQAEAMLIAGHEVAVLAVSSEHGLRLTLVNGVMVWRAGIRNLYSPTDELQQRQHGRISHALWHLLDSYNPLMAGIVRKVVHEFKPDVASCHNLPGWSISAWDELAAGGIPIVQVLHDQYLLCANSTMFRDGQLCGEQCTRCKALRLPHRRRSMQIDTLVGVSNFISHKLIQYGYFQGVRRTHTIHNVKDVSYADPLPAFKRVGNDIVFGYLGRLSQNKGVELLLETFSRLSQQHWKLLVAGSGEMTYMASLKSRFAHPRIEYLGHVLPETFFSRIDFTIVPSVWEDTLPSVVYESLLYGRPVVGSDVGGIPEMLTPFNGALFSAGDGSDLARVMEEMATDAELYRSRSAAIQQEAAPYRDKQHWVEEWVQVYADAVNAASLGSRRSAFT